MILLTRVMLDGIKLPRLYIAENKADAELAMSKGLPFIKWTRGQEELIKFLLRPVLERMFPHIKWSKVLGRKRRFKSEVIIVEGDATHQDMTEMDADMLGEYESWEPTTSSDECEMPEMMDEDGNLTELVDIANGERTFHDMGPNEMVVTRKLSLEDYVGDMSSYVNIDVLQRLRLMPAFIGDILECVKLNIGSGLYWSEGYNKRLGLPVGRFNASPQLPNLVILDISGSIPRGIAATMISLIDTLRTQLSADLIITAANSRFYPMGSQLPDPQRIRDMFGYGNECHDFYGILANHIRGKHYGHVFSFGDDDSPTMFYHYRGREVMPCLVGTTVEHVHHYHTWKPNTDTGYAKWCNELAKKPMSEHDTSWCKVIER